MLPNASALHHVALLYFGLGSGCLVFALALVCTVGGSKLGLEVILDLLFARLFLFLQRGEVTFSCVVILTLLLLGRLLLLLLVCQPCVQLVPSYCRSYLLCEISEHVGDLFDLLVLRCIPTRQLMIPAVYLGNLTRRSGWASRVALGRRLTAVHLDRLGDIAVAINNCGAFGKCDRLAGLALREIGLHGDCVSLQNSFRVLKEIAGVLGAQKPMDVVRLYFDGERGARMTYGISHDCG